MLAAAYLDWLYNALGSVMAFFYALVPSYAFAIAMLTITVRVFLIPLTAKQVKSQRAMQQLQPELKKLQAKHKGDRQKLNEEMMLLYKEHKANPLAGCLPLILQMPIFIVLYRLIIDLSKVKHIPIGSELHAALSASGGKLESLGMDLAEKPQTFIALLMVAAVIATGYFQQKQMTGRMPKDSINPQMAMVTKVFPVFFGLISLSVPAGVVVYFVVSNLWQIGQQAVSFRKRDTEKTETEEIEGPPAKPSGGANGKAGGKPGGKAGGAIPAKSGGSTPKSGGSAPKSGGGNRSPGSPKGGGPNNRSAKPGGGSGGGNRPPSGRVTPKGGPGGRVTPKGGPSGSAKSAPGQKGGKAGSASAATPSNDGEVKKSRLSSFMQRSGFMQRAGAKPPPPAARPKGLPPKGSTGGSSRKES